MFSSSVAMSQSVPRVVLRTALRPAIRSLPRAAPRRSLTTAPPHLRSRSWKNGALRWGIAIAGIYYYNTSPVFAESPQHNLLNPNVDALEDGSESATLDTITASSRQKSQKSKSVLQSTIEKTSADDAASSTTSPMAIIPEANESPADLEEEAAGQGAFNPETGEINWDCPCLGGMAHGPCGPQFREAFSCFVYSQEEPKGMECIDKFQNMQNCFREHPEHYKAELEDDEQDAELAQEREELTNRISERKAADKKSKETAQPAPARVVSSSEPHPGMSEEYELKNEGQSTELHRSPNPPKVEARAGLGDTELVTRAADDARTAPKTSR